MSESKKLTTPGKLKRATNLCQHGVIQSGECLTHLLKRVLWKE